MSSYIHFFVKRKTELVPIGIYCRSSVIYQMFEDYLPYEKVTNLTSEKIKTIMEDITDLTYEKNEKIDSLKNNIRTVREFNNSAEEKMDLVFELNERIDYLHEDINRLEHATSFCSFLNEIIDAQVYGESDDPEFDKDHYIYAGIECGEPSLDELKQWELD